MRVTQRIQEQRGFVPSAEEVRERSREGWRLAGVVWEREVESGDTALRPVAEVVPFGLRVASDCQHLEEDQQEREVILRALELIVLDYRLSQIATELNRLQFRTREGKPWNAASVFELLPRLIDVGARIFSSQEWAERRQRLFQTLQQ